MPARRRPAPSSEPESASDKENIDGNIQRTGRPNTARKGKGMSGMQAQTQGTQGSQKRRRDENAKDFYDPDQPAQERRAIARQQRELKTMLRDEQTKLLNPNDDSFLDALKRNEQVFHNVKQTNDALHDANFAVGAAGLFQKRVKSLNFGGAAKIGIGVDDFLTKIIGFARGAPGAVDDEYQELDWSFIGRETMCTHRRAPTTDYLLGPMSIVKKKRVVNRQRTRLAIREEDKARPQQLNVAQVKAQENKVPSLVVAVKQALEDFVVDHGDDNGYVDYLHFITNPHDFGQTVENMFYVSFLVKDGHAGLNNDPKSGRVRIGVIEAPEDDAAKKEADDRKKFTMIGSITMSQWRKTISLFNIKEPRIEHRLQEDDTPSQWAATQA